MKKPVETEKKPFGVVNDSTTKKTGHGDAPPKRKKNLDEEVSANLKTGHGDAPK